MADKVDINVMSKAVVNSPIGTLNKDITASDKSIAVDNLAATVGDLKPLFPLTIGLGEDAETILVANMTSTTVECFRGHQGAAKAWPKGTPIARTYTAFDHDTFVDNIEILADATQKALDKGDEAKKSGDDRNKELVANLASKGVKAATTDTIKINIAKVNDIITDPSKGTTAKAEDLISGKTAISNGELIKGSLVDHGYTATEITKQGQRYTIPTGVHRGSIVISNIENFKAAHIKKGVVVGGVTGTYDAYGVGDTIEATKLYPLRQGTMSYSATSDSYVRGYHVFRGIEGNTAVTCAAHYPTVCFDSRGTKKWEIANKVNKGVAFGSSYVFIDDDRLYMANKDGSGFSTVTSVKQYAQSVVAADSDHVIVLSSQYVTKVNVWSKQVVWKKNIDGTTIYGASGEMHRVGDNFYFCKKSTMYRITPNGILTKVFEATGMQDHWHAGEHTFMCSFEKENFSYTEVFPISVLTTGYSTSLNLLPFIMLKTNIAADGTFWGVVEHRGNMFHNYIVNVTPAGVVNIMYPDVYRHNSYDTAGCIDLDGKIAIVYSEPNKTINMRNWSPPTYRITK